MHNRQAQHSILAGRSVRLTTFEGSWKKQRLANGMAALHIPTPEQDAFYIGLLIRAGSRLETPANAGISHFLEHMMFRGSKRYPRFTDLAEAFEWLGGDWNAATGHEHTEYWYTGIRHTAPEVIELFADFLEHPQFADIDVERQVVLRELDGETNDHGHSTDIDYHIATLLWPQSSMSLPILGTAETLANITTAHLQAWRQRYYTPQNMVVCVVGGAADDGMLQLLEQHFATHRQVVAATPQTQYAPYKIAKGPQVKWVEHSDNEYEIRLAFACAGEWSDQASTYELISRILSDGFCSRLGRRLREELGLVYDVSADTQLFLEDGLIGISAACAIDQFDRFLKELFALLHEFVLQGPSEDELQRAVLRSLVDIELSPARPESLSTQLAWASICDQKWSLLTDFEKMAAQTRAGVHAVIKQVFTCENAALVAIGPSGKDIEKRLKKALVDGLKTPS